MIDPSPDESLDLLAGDWRIFQLRRGHRFSTDDLLCAWAGARSGHPALRLLDLGAGIGSVGLLSLWRQPPEAALVMVEAQEQSHLLARKTLAWNHLEERVEPRLGDLRDPEMVPESSFFDIVTCSPPYIPIGKGVISPVPQRAAARIELRGSIHDYMITASRALAPGGRIAIVFAARDPRPEEAIARQGLALLWQRDVCFREGQPPTIQLLVASKSEPAGPAVREPPLFVRDASGRWSQEMLSIRLEMGARPQDLHAGYA